MNGIIEIYNILSFLKRWTFHGCRLPDRDHVEPKLQLSAPPPSSCCTVVSGEKCQRLTTYHCIPRWRGQGSISTLFRLWRISTLRSVFMIRLWRWRRGSGSWPMRIRNWRRVSGGITKLISFFRRESARGISGPWSIRSWWRSNWFWRLRGWSRSCWSGRVDWRRCRRGRRRTKLRWRIVWSMRGWRTGRCWGSRARICRKAEIWQRKCWWKLTRNCRR